MFCFYTTRIVYYLTSSAGERQLGLGAPPSPPPAMGGTVIGGLLPSSGRIIPPEGSQLLSAHPGDNTQGFGPDIARQLHVCPVRLCGLGEVI